MVKIFVSELFNSVYLEKKGSSLPTILYKSITIQIPSERQFLHGYLHSYITDH